MNKRSENPWLLYPFLLAVYPVLFLYSRNMYLSSAQDALLPLMFSLALALAVWLAAVAFLKNAFKAALVTSLFLALFFTYGHVQIYLRYTLDNPLVLGRNRYLLPLYGGLMALGSFCIMKTRGELQNITRFLNVVCGVLVAMTVINIAGYKVKEWNVDHRMQGLAVAGKEEPVKKAGRRPDIYYLIFDSYTSAKNLKDIYGYDNSAFVAFLRKKGFYVVPNGTSNYAHTTLSFASSLNMDYLNDLSGRFGIEKMDTVITRMLQDSRIVKLLKEQGYKCIVFPSHHELSQFKHADLMIHTARFEGFSELAMVLLETTLLRPFSTVIVSNDIRSRTLSHFSKIPAMKKIKGPKFIFAHIFPPHPPFVFGPEGESIDFQTVVKGDISVNMKPYLNQLSFITRKIEVMVDDILASSEVPPIIILQGDHGPAFSGDSNNPNEDRGPAFHEGRIGPNPGVTQLKENMGILNAYYLPAGGERLLYETITPVNSFRVILKHYFDADMELLEDRNYFSSPGHYYYLTDVTDTLS